MLLEYAQGAAYDYGKLCRELRVSKTPSEKGFSWGSTHLGYGAYFEDVVRWLQQRHMDFSASNIRNRQNFECIGRLIKRMPIMVGVTWCRSGHWIVLDGVKDGVYRILDPQRTTKAGRRRGIREKTLFDQWDGTFVALESFPRA